VSQFDANHAAIPSGSASEIHPTTSLELLQPGDIPLDVVFHGTCLIPRASVSDIRLPVLAGGHGMMKINHTTKTSGGGYAGEVVLP
jgi:hypothetical protein